MSKKKKVVLGGLGIVIILGIIIFLDARKGGAHANQVETRRVARGEIVQKVNATGRIQPAVEVNISANVSGEIRALGVKEGDGVKKGQFLVQLDQERYQADVERNESLQKSAAAEVKLARSELKRIRDLHEKGLSSEAELEQGEARLEKAVSALEQQQAALKQSRDDLAKTHISSPIHGTVTRLEKEVGEIALGSTFQSDVIMTISDLSTMEVIVEVDESDVVDVSLGDSVEVEVDALPDTIFTGRVTEIAHSAVTQGMGTQEQVTNFEVTITLDRRAPEFRPGMSADVAIVTDIRDDALMVPIQAVTVRTPKRLETQSKETIENTGADNPEPQNSGNDIPLTTEREQRRAEMDEVVFVVNPQDMSAEQRKVETGISSDTHFEIVSGLDEGDEIVIGSYQAVSRDLQDGDKVERNNRREFASTAESS